MKVKLFVCRRLEQRVKGAIAEFGPDAVISSLRRGLEIQDGGAASIAGMANGTVRTGVMADGTFGKIA